ncbi:MAG TPA: sensor histidine kinase [Firmicutes bacterium]|nr:sensor histidine kinase [Bacillota bacterium]
MGLLIKYIKQHIKAVVLYFIFAVIFAIVFMLYRLPIMAVIYAASVCLFIGIIALVLNFILFVRKHKRLQELIKDIKVTCEHLPSPGGPLEEDYQEIVHAVYNDRQEITNKMRVEYTDLAEYYYLWAHQIKTPIASMRLRLQDDESELSRDIADDLQRIEQYVEMALMVLRLDSVSTDYIFKEYDLDNIIKQAIRKFASQFIRKKIKLNYKEVNCTVLTDEKWLLFVIEQVISNAIKYTPSGGTVTIDMERDKTLIIKDTGIGIAPEDLPRIFDKGYTGYNGRSDKKASGIGLYLSSRICKNLNHRIWAVSAIGEGTVVYIGLKRDKLEVE